jgi:hypothetical protein
MYSKKVTTNSGRPVNRARSSGTGVEMTDAHHHAARHHQRRGGEPELLGPQQRRDDHVAPGLQLTVGLHHDPVAQPVQHQRLLGLGQPEFPRTARVLERGQRAGPRSAVVPRDQDDVGVRLAHPGRHRTDAHLRHQLHVDARRRVGVLQVVDQLGQVLDRVDVVMRGR